MRHEISDYTDGDLIAAIRSPYQLQQIKDECEMEIARRREQTYRWLDLICKSNYLNVAL